VVVGAYHPSRQNTNTGKLTPRMYDDIFRSVRALLDGRSRSSSGSKSSRVTL
jgi:uracil-DNA glycosylase